MKEKVLGFKKKDGWIYELGEEGLKWKHIRVGTNKLVPVNLKTESITIKWLEGWCKENYWNTADDEILNDLLLAARKQAKGEKE